jgi:hypothetical protein
MVLGVLVLAHLLLNEQAVVGELAHKHVQSVTKGRAAAAVQQGTQVRAVLAVAEFLQPVLMLQHLVVAVAAAVLVLIP